MSIQSQGLREMRSHPPTSAATRPASAASDQTPDPRPLTDLFAGYPAPLGHHDSLMTADGGRREAWAPLIAQLDQLGAHELSRRWDHARRIIRENGVTYNVYGDPAGLDRPWQLDALPEVIDADEWERLAAGIVQRAHLLDLVLADCYGKQRLLRDGLIPPAAIFAHPGFLRPCHGLAVPGDHRLHLYAADLVRAADGAWRVMADRSQAPSGAGYALENRIVLSRALPEAFRGCRVQRVASFFVALRETLVRLAPRHRDNPRIVLLTPGPWNETYFEHAYLARYLGYTLVEGGDLTVRDDGVFLKTLGGLHPVDVILRRLDDDFCDPLELRNDSTLGIAGLVQAARAGNVAIVNALGSGLADNAALMPYLPRLCRHLIGEDLLLPSVETHWCASELPLVRERLDRLVIRPAFAGMRAEAVAGHSLSSSQREALLRRLALQPHAWVAQEPIDPSTTPVWTAQGPRPRPMSLRAFAVATENAYAVLPGGLCRIDADDGGQAASLRRGTGSKDTWVLARGTVDPVTLLRPPGAPVELRRGGINLPSRVADNLYWFGRYTERAQDTARLLRATVMRLADDPATIAGRELGALVRVLRHTGHLPDAAPGAAGEPEDPATLEARLVAMLRDADHPIGLPATLARLHDAGFAVRDRMSNDTGRILHQLHQHVGRDLMAGGQLGDGLNRLNQLVIHLAALSGMGLENTTRGQGWRFLDLGRRIERATFSGDLLRASLAGDDPDAGLDVVLEIADSAITYRSRYLTTLQPAPVLDLLLTDETNPRSIAFQLDAIVDHVAHLPRPAHEALPAPDERIALSMRTAVRLADPRQLAGEGLAAFLDRLSADLLALGDVVTRTYLSHLRSHSR